MWTLSASAQSTYDINSSGNWTDSGTWTPSGVPGSSDDIVIDNSSGTKSVSLDGTENSFTINSMSLNGTEDVQFSAANGPSPSTTIYITTDLTKDGSGRVIFDRSNPWTAVNIGGNLVVNSGSAEFGKAAGGSIKSVTVGGSTTVALGATVHVRGFGSSSFGETTLNGAFTFRNWNNESLSFNGLNGASTGSITVDAASSAGVTQLNLTPASGTHTFSGDINDDPDRNFKVRKTGAGTQVFAGNNTYTGTTTINAGTLVVNGTHTWGGLVTVGSSGTLGGVGAIDGTTDVNGILSPGNSPGTLTFTGDLNLNTGSTYLLEGGDLVAVDGTMSLNDDWTLSLSGLDFIDGGSTTIFTFGTLSGSPDLSPTFDTTGLSFTPTSLNLSQSGNSIVLNGVSVIPEPSTLILVISSLSAFFLFRRRR